MPADRWRGSTGLYAKEGETNLLRRPKRFAKHMVTAIDNQTDVMNTCIGSASLPRGTVSHDGKLVVLHVGSAEKAAEIFCWRCAL